MILKFWIGLVLGMVLLLFGGSSITGFGAASDNEVVEGIGNLQNSNSLLRISAAEVSGSGTLAFLIAGLCILALVVLNFVHEEKEITEK